MIGLIQKWKRLLGKATDFFDQMTSDSRISFTIDLKKNQFENHIFNGNLLARYFK